jgi:hypothetical protein
MKERGRKPCGLRAEKRSQKGGSTSRAPSLLWSTAIGLAKLQGDTDQIGERFVQALNGLQKIDFTTPNELMAAEIMTALSGQDLQSLESVLRNLDQRTTKARCS